MPWHAYEVWWFSTKTNWSLAEIRDASPLLKADIQEVDRRMNRAARTRGDRERKK